MSKERPPYDSHDSLVAEVATLKASFSQQRLDNLVDEINSLQHQIKTLRVRNEKDVEEIERLNNLAKHFSDTITAQAEEIEALCALITGSKGNE